MKKKWKWSNLYLGFMLLLMYLPLVVVVVFSFNESRLSAEFTGFSLNWYKVLAADRDLKEALGNSIILGALSCLSAAVIGTLGAVGMARVRYRSKGMMEYLSTVPIMIPEIILGMVFLVFFSMLELPYDNAGDCAYYLLYSLYFHDGKGTSGRVGQITGRGGKGPGSRIGADIF